MGSGKTTSCPSCFAEIFEGAICMTPQCVSKRPAAAVAPPPAPAIHEWPHIQQANVPFALALEHMKSHPAVQYRMDSGGPVSNGPECDYFRWDRPRGELRIFIYGSECRANGLLVPEWSAGALCTRIA